MKNSRRKGAADDKPTVQTVKLETALFVRLKMFGIKTRRSSQDILRTALVEYLKKMKG
jgi:predicted transcriptional regulator